MNYKTGEIPGPTRDRTWVNQPDSMYNSKKGTGYHPGMVRYANAVYTYTPNFADNSYKQGVIDEAADHVTFEFYTPYIIASTPASTSNWGIYEDGGKNGLVLHGKATCPVQLSTDQGKTWQDVGALSDGLDLTDKVKGYQQYLLRSRRRCRLSKTPASPGAPSARPTSPPSPISTTARTPSPISPPATASSPPARSRIRPTRT